MTAQQATRFSGVTGITILRWAKWVFLLLALGFGGASRLINQPDAIRHGAGWQPNLVGASIGGFVLFFVCWIWSGVYVKRMAAVEARRAADRGETIRWPLWHWAKAIAVTFVIGIGVALVGVQTLLAAPGFDHWMASTARQAAHPVYMAGQLMGGVEVGIAAVFIAAVLVAPTVAGVIQFVRVHDENNRITIWNALHSQDPPTGPNRSDRR